MSNTVIVECCGKKVEGIFCTYCGKKVKDEHPLASLLEHVATVFRHTERRLKEARRQHDVEPSNWYKREVESCLTKVEKWTVWSEALSEALKKDGYYVDG